MIDVLNGFQFGWVAGCILGYVLGWILNSHEVVDNVKRGIQK